MVFYCCVSSCVSNSKDSKNSITFHRFPSPSPVLAQWLAVLGRPNRPPSSVARVCSKHFTPDAFRWIGEVVVLVDDAVPSLLLKKTRSPHTRRYTRQCEMQVCRFCLVSGTKTVSLTRLYPYLNVVAPYLNDLTSQIEGLPHMVCYLCTANVMKCYKFLKMCQSTQDTLKDIEQRYGMITKSLVRYHMKVNGCPVGLEINKTSTLFDYRYDEDEHTSYLISSPILNYDCVLVAQIQGNLEETNKQEQDLEQMTIKQENELDFKMEEITLDNHSIGSDFDSEDEKALVPNIKKTLDEKGGYVIPVKEEHEDEKQGANEQTDRLQTAKKPEKKLKEKTGLKCKTKMRRASGQRKRLDELSGNELLMEEHFNIDQLTMDEQISVWRELTAQRSRSKKYICEVCGKGFIQHVAYRKHLVGHHHSRGAVSCPVCKLRYKSEVQLRSHVKFSHRKKYHCKICPNTFYTLCTALRHYKMHSGFVYSCSLCSFTTKNESFLNAHSRNRHPVRSACARCGLGFPTDAGLKLHVAKAHVDEPMEPETRELYKCEECDLSFSSEAARNVHYVTSFQHKKQRMHDPNSRRTCKHCGQQFSSQAALVSHARAEHGSSPAATAQGYPTDCEHCGVRLNSRKEHWHHVRQYHPKERASYQPVITAVCDTCGKGFQNTTKLLLHELRHASPTVRCEFCDKLFYDKYRLNDHLATHREAFPHRCTICNRGFKAQPNLARHYKTHTDIANYECTLCAKKFKYSTSLNLHVRSVHYKIPPPVRKKRLRTKNSASAAVGAEIVNTNF